METRYSIIERILRQIYGAQPTVDANITNNLVNRWLNDAVALAAAKNYQDNIQVDGMGYVNNSFYCSYSGISITQDPIDNQSWSFPLPQIPIAVGKNQGIGKLQFFANGFTSLNAIPLSIDQFAYYDRLFPIQNKVVYCPEGNVVRCKSPLLMNQYTATIKMVSAGDSTNLNSTLMIPDNYMNFVIEYCKQQLVFERNQPHASANDGEDTNPIIQNA